ncbi:MAG TPA: SGNH/GDSL hydrolase N-terminal domain-containing protein, partial [Candidatus Latescibacteria bacterium]|nr:SGNH/GDSL hydrolase N-terminal domain-containing protein [Candidatus Latescibacterota bacterium]
MKWIDFPNDAFVVNGLPWFGETKPHLWRLPERMKGAVRPPVWDLATNPSGGRIRFRTNTANLSLKANFTTATTYCNISIIGQMGYDIYSDGLYWRSFFPHNAS